jgi:hypothetical protein
MVTHLQRSDNTRRFVPAWAWFRYQKTLLWKPKPGQNPQSERPKEAWVMIQKSIFTESLLSQCHNLQNNVNEMGAITYLHPQNHGSRTLLKNGIEVPRSSHSKSKRRPVILTCLRQLFNATCPCSTPRRYVLPLAHNLSWSRIRTNNYQI